jgi:hypothetical protein
MKIQGKIVQILFGQSLAAKSELKDWNAGSVVLNDVG